MKSECRYFERVFIDYINGNTCNEDTEFCTEHLKTCEECKSNEMYEDFIFAWQKLDNWKDINPSKNFMSKLQHEIAIIEEKQRIFWYRIDYIFSVFRIPVMACFLLFFVSVNSISYANTNSLNLRKSSPYLEKRMSEIKETKISSILENIIKISKDIKGVKK